MSHTVRWCQAPAAGAEQPTLDVRCRKLKFGSVLQRGVQLLGHVTKINKFIQAGHQGGTKTQVRAFRLLEVLQLTMQQRRPGRRRCLLKGRSMTSPRIGCRSVWAILKPDGTRRLTVPSRCRQSAGGISRRHCVSDQLTDCHCFST